MAVVSSISALASDSCVPQKSPRLRVGLVWQDRDATNPKRKRGLFVAHAAVPNRNRATTRGTAPGLRYFFFPKLVLADGRSSRRRWPLRTGPGSIESRIGGRCQTGAPGGRFISAWPDWDFRPWRAARTIDGV